MTLRERRAAPSSFTQRVLTELAPHLPPLQCCRTALLLGMVTVGDDAAVITTTRLVAARTALQVLHALQQPAHVVRIATARRTRYAVWGCDLDTLPPSSAAAHCARSWLRGAMLGGGRIVRPESVPHIEIGCAREEAATAVCAALVAFGVAATVRLHRDRPLVTVRSTAGVGEVLSLIGASTARLQFESGRVLHEMRAGVNRATNAETANLRRSATASLRQLDAAEHLAADPRSWELLPPALREAATLRREHPEADLDAMARLAGCSRSAMAGRLHRLVDASSGAVPVLV